MGQKADSYGETARTAWAPYVSCSQRRGGSERRCRQSPSRNHRGWAPPEPAPPGKVSPHSELLLLLRAAGPQVTHGGSPSPFPELEATPAPSQPPTSRFGPSWPPRSAQPPTSHPPLPLGVCVTDTETYVLHRISVLLLIEEFVERSHVGLLKTGLKQNRSLKRSLRSLGPNLKDLECGRNKPQLGAENKRPASLSSSAERRQPPRRRRGSTQAVLKTPPTTQGPGPG